MRQPAYQDVLRRVVGDLHDADTIMHDVLWVGAYRGLDEEEIRFIARSIRDAGHVSRAVFAAGSA